ncbi:MAG TPA: Fe-S cluster assembly ATPase SufC [Patescibacteria group bacterium]|nr:Fe-S cluster assembly ATPase SufC [Patescibacteria group bacterium]
MLTQLRINNLHVKVDEKEILHGIDLSIQQGEVHALMGPNGSGKSTLSLALFGHPRYHITQGSIFISEQDITTLAPHKRAHLGLFLTFQSPQAIPGVTISTFLKQAINAKRRAQQPAQPSLKIREYRDILQNTMNELQMPPEFADRYLNSGFSGGERKKSEILQMALLQPTIVVLDEIDSGLDVDALRIVCEHINRLRKKQQMGILIITHYPRILSYIKPDYVHVLMDGRIVTSGTYTLAHQIETRGYEQVTARL